MQISQFWDPRRSKLGYRNGEHLELVRTVFLTLTCFYLLNWLYPNLFCISIPTSRGFAGDPSIIHQSKLHPAVTFHNVGLKMLRTNEEQRRDPSDEWILTSLPSLKKFLGWDYLDIGTWDEFEITHGTMVKPLFYCLPVLPVRSHSNRYYLQ